MMHLGRKPDRYDKGCAGWQGGSGKQKLPSQLLGVEAERGFGYAVA